MSPNDEMTVSKTPSVQKVNGGMRSMMMKMMMAEDFSDLTEIKKNVWISFMSMSGAISYTDDTFLPGACHFFLMAPRASLERLPSIRRQLSHGLG